MNVAIGKYDVGGPLVTPSRPCVELREVIFGALLNVIPFQAGMAIDQVDIDDCPYTGSGR